MKSGVGYGGKPLERAKSAQRVEQAAMHAATPLLDRVADGVLVAALLTYFWYWQLVWPTEISRTRELVIFYSVVALVLAKRPWRDVPRIALLPASSMLILTILGFLSWSHELGSSLGLNFWSEEMARASMLIFGVTYGVCRWRTWRWILIVGASLVAAFQLGVLAVGVTTTGHSDNAPAFYGSRPVAAQLALLILCGFVLVLSDRTIPSRTKGVLGTFLGMSVVVAQHRSVWVAFLIACILLVVLMVKGQRTGGGRIALGVSLFFLVLALALPVVGLSILPGSAASTANRELPESATSADTFAWRIDMWKSRLAAPRSVWEWVWGGVTGQTPAFGPASAVMNPLNSAHNALLDIQLMTGAMGLSMFLFLFGIAVFRGPSLGALKVFLWSALGFGVFYPWPAWVWLLLGVSTAYAATSRHSSSTRTSPAWGDT